MRGLEVELHSETTQRSSKYFLELNGTLLKKIQKFARCRNAKRKSRRSLVDSHVKKLVKQVDSVGIDWGAEKLELQKKINAGAPIARQRALDQIDITYSLDNKDKRILDYGCGTGIFNLLLLLKGYTEVHGVDVVPKFDARILERLGFSDASFNLIGVDERLPFEDGSFDVVTSCLVLEHVENLGFYYGEAARVLKPGGVCFFNFPPS